VRSLRDLQPLADLVCVRDGLFSQDYDFLLDGERCGSLEWERGLRPRALAETEGHAWWIERTSLWSRDYVMLAPGTKDEVATFRRRLFGSDEISLADGRTFRWRRVGAFSMTLRCAIERDGADLVEFSSRWSLFNPTMKIEVFPTAAHGKLGDELTVLILLGSYVFIRVASAQSWS
jgi:hypothetical protein